MKVLLFGSLTDVVGTTLIDIKNATNTEMLKQYLINKYPTLADCNYQVAINRQQVNSITSLNDNDEIALLPPFAGG